MKDLINNFVGIKIDNKLKRKIDSFLAANPNLTISDLIREAVMFYLAKDIEDRELVALNVQKLVKQGENQKDAVYLGIELLCYFIKSWLVYIQEIPGELKDAAWQKGEMRFNKFMDGFKSKLQNDTSIIEKLIMSFVQKEANTE